MLRAAAARAHSNERAVGALSCARQLRGLRIDFRRQLHAAAAAAARSGAPQQWVFSRYGALHQGLEFSATQRAAAAKLFRAGGTHEGTQLDPKYFAPGPGQAEVALIGRSNAGKSSLLNALLGQRLSSTSKRPGHTEDLHFFRVPARQELFLVDLPGYGYAAHRAKAQKAAWMELIAGYLHDRGRDGGGVCRRVLLLVDVRRGLTQLDREVVEMMEHFVVPYQVVLTKADAAPASQRAATAAMIAAELGDSTVAFPTVHLVSALQGQGMQELQVSIVSAAGLLPAEPR